MSDKPAAPTKPNRISQRGFASMSPDKQRRLASKGGTAAHAGGKGRQWDSEQAREAGRKGGLASRRGPAKPKG